MSVEFRCPNCGKLLRTPDASAGKKGKCPHCQTVTDIPQQSTVTPSPAPSATPSAPAAPKTDLFASHPGVAPAPAPPDLFANVPSTPAPSTPDLFSNLPGGTSSSTPTDLFGGTPSSASPPMDKAQALFADPFGPSAGGGYGGGSSYGGGDYGGGGGGYAAAPNPYGAPSYAASQPQYGYPQAGGYQSGPPHRASLVLTLGILSLVGSLGGFLLTCCCAALFGPLGIIGLVVELLALVVGIPACVFGTIDLRKMKQGDMDPSGYGMTMTGFVMGIVSTILGVLYLLMVIVLFALVGVAIFSGQMMKPPPQGF